jgi:hypothetical protein
VVVGEIDRAVEHHVGPRRDSLRTPVDERHRVGKRRVGELAMACAQTANDASRFDTSCSVGHVAFTESGVDTSAFRLSVESELWRLKRPYPCAESSPR